MFKVSYIAALTLLAAFFVAPRADALTLRAYTNAGSGELHLTLQEETGAALTEFGFVALEGLGWQASTSASGPGTPLDDFLGNLADMAAVGLSLDDVVTDSDPGSQQFDPMGGPLLLFVIVSPGTLGNIIPLGGAEVYLGSVLIEGDETNPDLGFLDPDLEPILFELILVPEPSPLIFGLFAAGLFVVRREKTRV